MDCAELCFTDERYRFENVLDIYKICLVPECNCVTGDVTYSKQEMGNISGKEWLQRWSIHNFGTGQDLYDKNGNQIYATDPEGNEFHLDFDETTNEWLDTWHLETNTTVHSAEYYSLENYYSTFEKGYSWISLPEKLKNKYAIEKDCDDECSEECMSLSGLVDAKIIDACNVQKCNCYLSTLSMYSTCSSSCLATCDLKQNYYDYMDCVNNDCLCDGESPALMLNIRNSFVEVQPEASVEVPAIAPIADSVPSVTPVPATPAPKLTPQEQI